MTSGDLILIAGLNLTTAVGGFLATLLRPERYGLLAAMALSHFGTMALITLWLALFAGPLVFFYSIGMTAVGLIGTLLGGGAGELVRMWHRRSLVTRIITFRGTLERFAIFEPLYVAIAARKAQQKPARSADLIDAATLKGIQQPEASPLERLLDGVLAGEYSLGALSFHRGVGRLAYLPAKGSLKAESLPLKMLVEIFGFEIVGESWEGGMSPR